MTNLQVRYQELQEAKRANEAKEYLASQEVSVKEREAQVKEAQQLLNELKAPAEIQELVSKANLSDQQVQNLIAELPKIEEQVLNIRANTLLTNAQKYNEYATLGNKLINLVHRVTGATPLGDSSDTLKEWIGNFIGGLGKGVSSLIG